jgi:hypothetical protein
MVVDPSHASSLEKTPSSGHTLLLHPELCPLDTLFEPVLIIVCVPFLSHRPQFALRGASLAQIKQELHGPRLQKSHLKWFRDYLRELHHQAREVCRL